MDDFQVHILKQGHIRELAGRFPPFAALQHKTVPKHEKNCWVMDEQTIYCLQVIFLGKTGYGKSSTINRLIGEDIFAADDFSSCTNDLYAAEYQLANTHHFFSLGDLPGVGESVEADKRYLEIYQNMLCKASVVVYMLRADQRDFAIDLDLFDTLFADRYEKEKIVIGLNFIDNIQSHLLPAKLDNLSRLFNISRSRIACFSAAENRNMDDLANKIMERIRL